MKLFADHLEAIESQGQARVQLAGRPFTIKRQFLLDVAENSLKAKIAELHRALLVMHVPGDFTVGIVNAMHIFMAARHPKSFVSLDNVGHLLTNRADAAYAANIIATWAKRYIAASDAAR